MATKMPGTIWKPVPRHQSDHVLVEIKEGGSRPGIEEEEGSRDNRTTAPMEEDRDKDPEFRTNNVTDIIVSNKDLAQYGATPDIQ